MKKWVCSLALVGLVVLVPLGVDAQEFSVRTNLLWDAVSEPNIGLEFSVSDHWSVGGNAGLKSWPRWLAWDWDQENPTHWRNFALVPEVRYYLNQVYQGLFFGADALYTHYNVGKVPTPFHMYPAVEEYRLQGSFWAGGVFAGYAWWPWQHWRVELEAGAAVGLAAYDRFVCDNCGTKLGEERKVAVVPKLGVNLAYNPVSRDESQRRRMARRMSGPADTVTLKVMTPPVAFVVQLGEVKAPETAGDQLAKAEPWIMPISQHRPMDYGQKTPQDSILKVYFPQGAWALDKDYGHNGTTLDRVAEAVRAIRDDGRINELLVSIVGLASIDGPEVKNDTLSARRARALANYIQEETGVGGSHFEIISRGEAWDLFQDQLDAQPEGFTPEELNKIREILRKTSDADARERLLKSDAPLYGKVAENLLARQRNAGYIRVYYGVEPDAATEKLNGPVQNLLKSGRYHDAVRAIEGDAQVKERVQSDPEAANAYGIALYFSALDNKDAAQEKEAIRLIEQAALRGSAAAAENLKGIEIYGPARKEYEAWMQIMNNNEQNKL